MSDVDDNGVDVDGRLELLARATESIGPRADFHARVAAAIAAADPPATWIDDVLASARRLVPAAVLVAACGVMWAVQSDRAYDDAVAARADDIEAEW